MSEELTELEEHAEHAREHPDLAPVTLTMAVLAVLVATVSLLGHRTHTEEIILQNKATDQWGHYQAKNIRRHTDELFADLTGLVASKDAEAVAKLHEKYLAEADRYKDEQKELDTEARELEKESDLTRRKADRFDLGEVFLEIALVITSITLLSGRRIFWHVGLFMATAGVLVAASAWLLR
jgi:LPS O-antigen subunit length determinant protein (WzzB/FepE family)